ncbi:MAG: hypothetical protein RLZZ331_681 [Pseudomonadota bacterium]|jgi:hypothetical protein|uniref:hypothetical protein n=1 Tax=Sandarakinorhabdus limnophila TaxID=210512 RepID=UPI0026F3428D|nr:hypothetical protein [Sandarakinorhabdus limnophila]
MDDVTEGRIDLRDDGVTDSTLSTPRTRKQDNPQSYFPFHPLVDKERDVYRAILRAAKAMAEEGVSVRGVPITKELYHLILFATHSFPMQNCSAAGFAPQRRSGYRFRAMLTELRGVEK